eukprot:977908-Pleurochrysis_carterae.AAC.3
MRTGPATTAGAVCPPSRRELARYLYHDAADSWASPATAPSCEQCIGARCRQRVSAESSRRREPDVEQQTATSASATAFITDFGSEQTGRQAP